ncbi:hypothetical protein HS088_TW14G00058 [Tripterygium wilfordii]|uniref:GDSL esterase/lipase EXL3-like n=1 Tax=Tripterygium wilfordii TaxID=458696 RepID=A0A7J7CPJ2_TRIWF|nr:hypothetical protein HS088_TW14G00058 [Tripterygium wilfordii]
MQKDMNETVPAVIVFGDSIVDPGNNNYMTTIIKCNFPRYGKDFMGGQPTGRFSNGRIPSDLLAETFGVKKLVPPYLDPNLDIQDLVTGVSFASGVLSLSDQLDLFKDYLSKIKQAKDEEGEDTVGNILAKGIFIVCTGSDDIANTYFPTPTRKLHYDINSYTDFLVKSASTFYQPSRMQNWAIRLLRYGLITTYSLFLFECAEAFGIKDLLPAYLDPNLTIRDLHTGVSFASAGSGYDPLTAKLVSVLSLSDQLHLFKDYLRKIKHVMGEETMGRILAKGIFIVCAGGDDIVNTYFPTLFRIIDHDIHSYTDLMVKSASSFYQELHKLGVRRIGVFGVSTMGCLPSQRTTRGGIQRKCSASENQASQIFNSKLSSEIDVLNENLVDLKLVYFDSYHSLLHLVSNPSQYVAYVITCFAQEPFIIVRSRRVKLIRQRVRSTYIDLFGYVVS